MNPDAFAAVADLIGLISDPKACAKRMAELQVTIAAADRAQAQLEAARIANERAFAVSTADLDRRRAKIIADEVELRLRRDAFDQREASSAERFPHDPNFAPGTISHSGLARDHYRE
jgi:hypothetical protein